MPAIIKPYLKVKCTPLTVVELGSETQGLILELFVLSTHSHSPKRSSHWCHTLTPSSALGHPSLGSPSWKTELGLRRRCGQQGSTGRGRGWLQETESICKQQRLMGLHPSSFMREAEDRS